MKKLVPLLIIMWALAACADTNVVYHSYQYIAGKGWDKHDTLTFDVRITDSIPTSYRLYMQIRNRADYPYQNLLLLVCHNLQDSSVVVTDTVRCTLANDTGRWKGKGLGGLFQTFFNVNEYISQYPIGAYTVHVIQGMEDQTLTGINDVGIRIER